MHINIKIVLKFKPGFLKVGQVPPLGAISSYTRYSGVDVKEQ